MKNSIKKLIAGIAATASIASLCFVTACGGGGGDQSNGGNGGRTLRIEAVELGYGVEWLKAIGKEWEKATGNKVDINPSIGTAGNDAIATKIEQKADRDIFIYRTSEYATRIYEGEITVKGQKYPNVFLDITDVCTKALDGEDGATIDSKLNEDFKKIYKVNDKYYGLPWIEGVMGILRNVDVWEKFGFTDADVPLTTDQLFDVCEQIKAKAATSQSLSSVKPFIYSSEDEYYTSFMGTWFMQYETDENIKNYFAGKDPNGNYSKDLFSYQGHKEMLSVVEKLVKKTNGYQHPESDGINFTDMQGYFLKGQSVFCVNGAWLEIEMETNSGAKIDYIKTPVISALANRLSFSAASDKDDKLAELVKFVDANASGYEGKPEWATEKDVDEVRKARGRNYNAQGSSHALVAASYSPNVDLIKSFIEYMYSDKGMDCYYRATNGASLPLNLSKNGKYSDVELSDFQKEVNKIKKDEVVIFASTDKMYSIGGVNFKLFNGVSNYVNSLYSGELTANDVLAKNREFMNQNWSRISGALGI